MRIEKNNKEVSKQRKKNFIKKQPTAVFWFLLWEGPNNSLCFWLQLHKIRKQRDLLSHLAFPIQPKA